MGATQGHARPGRAELGPPTPAAGPDELGGTIANRYRLIARIHAGSAGTLYQAEDLAFSRTVALRLLTPALSRDEAVLARLQARLQATAAMARDDLGASGDIVELTDLGRAEGGLVFVVTDFLAGESLAAQLAREGPLQWHSLRPLMVRACQIIHLSHQHGLLRLDLQTRHFYPIRDKTQESTLKILSPGIGDVFGDSLWAALDPAAAAAHLRYAAPEQVTGGNVDARTDVYALGIIMFELLSGRVPFADTRPAYVCARHLLEPPPPLRANVPPAVVGIVGKALAKQPEDRWPTMRALANAMAAIEFGPCDASGMLEVVDLGPPGPAASSTSMRIDPAAGHAPSPAVRPRTMPPTRDAFMADAIFGPGVTAVLSLGTPSTTSPVPSVSRQAEPVAAPAQAASSSSRMAWEEILRAADEAVAAVAAGARTGTAGDSGVFIPESLLRTGGAATASMTRGRLPGEHEAANSLSDTLVMPRTLVAPSRIAPDPLGDSEAELSALREMTGESATQLSRTWQAPPAPALVEVDRDAEASQASHGSLRSAVDRSTTVWPRPARPRRVRGPALAWAAAALLVVGGALGLRSLRATVEPPRPALARVEPPRSPPAMHSSGALPAAIAPGRALDLSSGTAERRAPAPTPRPAPRHPSQWPEADDLSPGPGEPGEVAAAPVQPARPVAEPPRVLVMRTATRAGDGSAAARLAKTSTEEPAAPTRKSPPGARLPDAGHELAAPLDPDPLTAASLLEKAEQAAARGEQALALSLALQSYHAQPTAHALRVAGVQACRLGDASKARWARQQLGEARAGTVDAACTAAGLALE